MNARSARLSQAPGHKGASVRTGTVYVDYQQRASEFHVGDVVLPYGADESQAARVVAVYPAIGMVDVEFPHGSKRLPVEDVQRITGVIDIPADPEHNSIPGGTGTVSVPGGPHAAHPPSAARKEAKGAYLAPEQRVAEAYVKRALYWASADRHYRATQAELDGSAFHCPKCKETVLKPANYKREEGRSERLMACPSCLFLIKRCDIIGHPDYIDDGVDGVEG
ncbi:MAG: hypothetical protein A2Y38_08810 [Spirochaetes bacterium GWB1_59_5]|nr:MAG: hypothetical protein A2Y38_08810 [Spirochaetes bacterium GWB1_59_5]